MKKIMKYIFSPSCLLIKLSQEKIIWLPDWLFLKLQFQQVMKCKLDLDNPKTFNEKLQWLKLFDRKAIYTKLVDKYEAKKISAKIIGDKYIVPTYGVYDRFDDIDFEKLPNQFAIKTTHFGGSHGVFVVKDKNNMDFGLVKKEIGKTLKKNLYYYSREWPYKDVKPRIIIEECLDGASGDIIDYKFMCFNGRVEYIFTCTERFSKGGLRITIFDRDWHQLPFERSHPKSDKKIKRPYNLDEMIILSEKLAEGIPFVRVDFYNPRKGVVKFGEFTLYPGAGLGAFQPEIWDRKLGDLIKLPEKEREK